MKNALTPPEPELDLDTQIALAEQRLMARELRLRGHVTVVTYQTQRALKPWRWAVPLVAGGAALWAVWRLLRGRPGPRPDLEREVHMATRSEVKAGLPWGALLALAWPLLPLMWRTQVSETTAHRLLAVGLPLAQRVLQRRR